MERFSARKVKTWLQQCLDTHESCKKAARLCTISSSDNMLMVNDLGHDDKMPRRLLTFSSQDTATIRLIDINVTSQPIPYIALSHSWGKNESCIATKENPEELKTTGIRFEDLPRTYRDAVVVTKDLGYCHLWIDSLSIVQDDAEDWKTEALRMAVVQRGSLETRAWVMQERMISPRSIVFTENTVSWECRQSDASACANEDLKDRVLALNQPQDPIEEERQGATTISQEMVSPDHPKELFAFFRDFRLPGFHVAEDQHRSVSMNTDIFGGISEYEPCLVAWWIFLSLYTPRQLTYGKDKLLAMNGIAAAAQRYTLMKNNFGLWYHFIEHELLWCIDPDGPEAIRSSSLRSPSWSWAGLDQKKVLNRYYTRLPLKPQLMIKPQSIMPVGTSFDKALPIPA
ncbi:hypothetical protein BT63DRAFT_472858 [Microthyrium microscopicum]|uniref:Heterokaryon incompatibility domain-containing protein n=1 Tax=Microthyrium microscopicum TaxID=703497 RepID=A0A6A6U5E3_9PEZI|nr:hypothetical protein BT63DRAFT_472858 [Microthyrium microscopicum]